jgi:hypothetical protein
VLGEEALKLVGAFKYLGTWLEPSLKHGKHLAVMEERARIATGETVKVIRNLDIRESRRFSMLYRALVESQMYGIELFPACAAPVLSRVRRVFLASLHELPADMSSTIATFLLRLLPPELAILKARRNFLKRLERHAVPAVHLTLRLEEDLSRRSVGWAHENYIVARQICPTLRKNDFSLSEFTDSLFTDFPDLDKLNFVLIQKRALENPALSFFDHLPTYYHAVMFRRSLGTLTFDQARIVLLFFFSGLRWRISRIPLKTCPFCPRFELFWGHFLECEIVQPFLLAEFIEKDLLLDYARGGRWRDAFTIVGEVIRIWGEVLSTFALDVDVVASLAHLP